MSRPTRAGGSACYGGEVLLPLVTGEARFESEFVPVHRAGGGVLYALRE